MRIKNIWHLLLLFVLTSYPSAQLTNKISIAVIAEKSSGLDKSPLVSLLEVELSQREGIKLLERAAIDKILEEQKLSATGLLDRNSAITIGKLLRADAFIILSLENKTQDANDLIRIRISETVHGLRLLDYFEQSDSANPEESVERIIKKIETVINKINQPDEKLIPIGIVDIHRVQLGEQYKMLERTLPVMLSVRLSLEPQIIMLEREDLKVLLDEKLRTEGEDSKFWNSAVLIEGYLQPNSGHLEMHLNLKQAGGDNIKSLTVQIEPNEPASAITKASTEIIQQLQNSPPLAQWLPEQEAEQFYKQGKMLSAHSRYEEALPLFETAHALQPHNIFYTAELFENIWQIRQEKEIVVRYDNTGRRELISEPRVCPYSEEELAELASIFVIQIRDGVIKGQVTAQEIYRNKWSSTLGISMQDVTGYFSSSLSVTSEQARLLNRENRKIWVETMETAIKKNPFYINYRDIASMAWISTDDPNELIKNLKNAYKKFVLPPELGGEIKSPKERDLVFRGAFEDSIRVLLQSRNHLKNNYPLILKLWKEYLTEMAKVNDPVIQLKNFFSLCDVVEDANSKEMERAKYYVNESLKIISQQLKNPDETIKTSIEVSIYELKNKMERLYYTKNELLKIWSDFYEPFIKDKDTIALACCNPGFGPPHMAMMYPDPNYYSENNLKEPFESSEAIIQWNQLLQRIAEVLESGNKNPRVTNALYNIHNRQYEIEYQISSSSAPQERPDITVKILMKSKYSSQYSGALLSFHGQIKIQNEMLWAAQELYFESSDSSRTMKSIISLAGINLEQKKLKSLWETEPSRTITGYLTGLIINEDVCYLSIINIGILAFPGSKIEGQEQIKNQNIITQKDGLPSNSITSMVQEGDKIWISYGYKSQESGLGLYDLKTKKWDTVFCSTIEDKPSFNSSRPYQLKNLIIPQKGKLFFLLDSPMNIGKSGNWKKGIWMLDIVNRTTQYLCPIEVTRDIIKTSENKLLILSASNLIEYDIPSGTIKLIYGRLQSFLKSFSDHGFPAPDFNKDLTNPEKTKGINNDIYFSFGVIHNNKLWAHYGFYQIIIIDLDKNFKDAQIIDNDILDGNPVEKFISTPYGLIGIGRGIVGLIETGD